MAFVWPDKFICPLTRACFVDPVQASNGMAFERKALAAHFAAHPEELVRCPVHEDILERDFVIPHTLMRMEMDEYLGEKMNDLLKANVNSLKEWSLNCSTIPSSRQSTTSKAGFETARPNLQTVSSDTCDRTRTSHFYGMQILPLT